MGVASIRFNKNEQGILNFLKNHYHCDTSSLLKKSLWELFEDTKDNEIIEEFEKKKNPEFFSFEEIMK